MYKIYSWQVQKWQQLFNCKTSNKLPHAILLNGVEGIGKFDFAYNFAQNLLCQYSTHEGNCGNCNACKLLQSSNHPDLFIIKPEPKAKNIKIDQIRDLITDLNNTAQQGGRIVVIIKHADLLNIAAANALLKTLEEPAANVCIILTTHNISSLPATIRSRCQIINMPTPEFTLSFAWVKQHTITALADTDLKIALALTQNAPLKALDILQTDTLNKRLQLFEHLYNLRSKKNNFVKVSEACLDWELNNLLTILMSAISDIVRIKFAMINGISNIDIINIDQASKLQEITQRIQLDDIFAYQKQLLKLKQDIMQNINLNKQLAFESLFINWTQLF